MEVGGDDKAAAASTWLRGWRRLLARDSCFLAPIETARDLVVLPSTGRLGVLVGFQSSTHFRETSDVDRFFELGQRVSQLTYDHANHLGGGCRDAVDRGLTAQGVAVIERMNQLGMVLDISHCGAQTSVDAIEASKVPVLATHTNCKALNPGHPRCKSDEVIVRLARRGGVLGLTIVRAFVSARRRPSLDDLLDHFEHVIRLVGPSSLALGSDADYQSARRPLYELVGLDPVARVFQIADGLLRRGYHEADVRLILGANAERVLSATLPPKPDARTDTPDVVRDPFCPVERRRPPRGVNSPAENAR